LEGMRGAPAKPGKVTLRYFPIAGRAEPIRLALLLGGFKYFDERVDRADWEQKYKKQAPYGQLPTLTIGAKTIAQTKAILRYVGKLTKHKGVLLYPKDPLAAAKVDELLDVFDDLWILLAPTFRIADQGQKELVRKKLFVAGAEAAVIMDTLEKAVGESSSDYVVPQAGLTIADLTYFGFITFIRSGFIEGLEDRRLFEAWPKILAHKERIGKIPEIAAYYKDNARSNPTSVPFYKVYKPER